MNILVLTSTNGSYNSVRPEAEIYISLAKYGYNITIMTQEKSEYTSRFVEHGIKIIDSSYKKKFSFNLIQKIRKTIKQESIDILYATNSKSISNAVFASIGTKVKLITYRGTTGGLYRYDPASYLNALNPRVDGTICVSKAVEKHVRKQLVFSRNKNTTTIYKGHDLAWYNQKTLDLKEFGTNRDNFNIAFVANVRPHKGLIYVLQATHALADIKNIHLLLIGNEISKEPYISEIENSSMKERIHVTGFRNDAPDIISACDVLIQASTRKEGLPRVILESIAEGTPVIASANEGSMEIVEDGFNGYVVPIKNSIEIAKRVKELYGAPQILKRLSENCKDIIENKMAHKTTVKKYIDYFESLLQR